MKSNFKIRLLILLTISILTISLSNAYPLPRNYSGFVWETSTSGTLKCTGSGVCAEVIDGVVYFSRWQGRWDYDYVVQQTDAEYFITEVEEVDEN